MTSERQSVEILDDLKGPPARIELASVNSAAEILGRPLAQAQLLSEAGLLGAVYMAGNMPLYLGSTIEWLRDRPRRTKADVLSMVDSGELPPGPVVVIRQRARIEEPNGIGRTWFGYDHASAVSEDPALREEQKNATRYWWSISPSNRDRLNRIAAGGGTIPCIVSIGGLVAACWTITGLDHEFSTKHPDRWAFAVEPPGEWADELVFTWLDSGAGKSILWWG